MPAMTRQSIERALSERTYLTFGGNETFLLFIQGYPLREFCAFEVVDDEKAFRHMEQQLLEPIADAAAERGLGLITDCFVWRASADYVERLGYTRRGVAGINQSAVRRTRQFVESWRSKGEAQRACPIIIAGDLGPRGDGYAAGSIAVEAAHDYHAPQLEALANAGVDLVVALTMTSESETLGILRAAERVGLQVVVSPTVETDGRIPDGTTLATFVTAVDAQSGGYPVAYMANCAHPTHIAATLRAAADRGESWLERFRGLRANASDKSHAELDNSTELDRGDPAELAKAVSELRRTFRFTIIGGCCGTDAEHLRAIAATCT